MSRLKNTEIPGLNARQLQQLQSRSPTAEDIFKNIDHFNDEIVEQAVASGATVVEPTVEVIAELTPAQRRRAKVREVPAIVKEASLPVAEPTQSLDDMNAELELKLEQQKIRLAAEAQAAAEASPEPQEVVEQDIATQVRQMLREAPNAPSEAQIAAWKQAHGVDGVQVLAMGKSDVYVFTFLRRKAFQQLQAAMAKRAQLDGMSGDPEEFMMEQVLKQCILYPRPLDIEFFYNSRSGVIPTLYNTIMLHSYHLSPQQAMVLTTQL